MADRSYRLESLELGAIDTYVRVTLHNVPGMPGNTRCKCTKRECPTAEQVRDTVLELYQETYGYAPTLNDSQLVNCARAAKDARRNREECAVMLPAAMRRPKCPAHIQHAANDYYGGYDAGVAGEPDTPADGSLDAYAFRLGHTRGLRDRYELTIKRTPECVYYLYCRGHYYSERAYDRRKYADEAADATARKMFGEETGA